MERPGDAAGQLDEAPLPGRQRPDRLVGERGQTAQGQGVRGAGGDAGLLSGPAQQMVEWVPAGVAALAAERHVLADGERVEQLHLLERAAEAAASPGWGAEVINAVAVEPDRSAARPDQALKVVVLPAPFGPMSPVIWPTGAARVTVSAATRPPKRTVTRSTLSSPSRCSSGTSASVLRLVGCCGRSGR